MTLSCPAEGKPDPQIIWSKDGQILFPHNISKIVKTAELIGNEIKIMRVKVDSFCSQICVLSLRILEGSLAKPLTRLELLNKISSLMFKVKYLKTGNSIDLAPPKILREGIPTEHHLTPLQDMAISCPVLGKPTPSVTWFKGGKALTDSHLRVSANGQRLFFKNPGPTDADRYTCVASNPAGVDKRDFVVKLLGLFIMVFVM